MVGARVKAAATPYDATKPTRTRAPVGAGIPPAGSIVTANATGEDAPGGKGSTAATVPDPSGDNRPALTGAEDVTAHSW